MPKDWRHAVLVVLVALPLMAAAGPAGATDEPHHASHRATVGVGIDHTMHARNRAALGTISAVDAVDLLNRPVNQALPTRHPGPVANPIGALRGLLIQGGLDSAVVGLSSASSDSPLAARRGHEGPMPYVRFGDGEQVFGFSFKIQPPSQAPELPSPRS